MLKTTKIDSYNLATMMVPPNSLKLWQKAYIKSLLAHKNKLYQYNIEGDAWKLELKPNNIVGKASFSLKDYDENNNLEAEINLDLDKDELDGLIKCLQDVNNHMKNNKKIKGLKVTHYIIDDINNLKGNE